MHTTDREHERSAVADLTDDIVQRYGRKAYEAIEHDRQRGYSLPTSGIVAYIANWWATRNHKIYPPKPKFHGELMKGPWIE